MVPPVLALRQQGSIGVVATGCAVAATPGCGCSYQPGSTWEHKGPASLNDIKAGETASGDRAA